MVAEEFAERRPQMGTKRTDPTSPEETEDLAAVIRRNRRSPEEVARLAEGHRPFSYKQWQREAPPATPEELAETEEFLRLRNLEREASIPVERGPVNIEAIEAAKRKLAEGSERLNDEP
jgi:hypothetical protein